MPLITNGQQARQIIQTITTQGKALPCFCTESVYTTEAIFKGAKAYKTECDIDKLPIIIAFTASYQDRQQLKNYTGLNDFREGLLAVKADIERLSRPDGPYADLDVIVHLDHAQPDKDKWIVEEYQDFIASVMWDCSHYSMTDNKKIMTDFVKRYHDQFVIEGAVDEIYNYDTNNQRGELIDNITDPTVAKTYCEETGVDLIVANVGTEHRRTEGTVKYHQAEAQAISQAVGRKLVLHGTSSIQGKQLATLAADGFVKINLWGKLEANPGKLLVEKLIRELPHQLPKKKVEELIKENLLAKNMLAHDYKPSIHYLTEKYRRDSIYLPEATAIVKNFYSILYK